MWEELISVLVWKLVFSMKCWDFCSSSRLCERARFSPDKRKAEPAGRPIALTRPPRRCDQNNSYDGVRDMLGLQQWLKHWAEYRQSPIINVAFIVVLLNLHYSNSFGQKVQFVWEAVNAQLGGGGSRTLVLPKKVGHGSVELKSGEVQLLTWIPSEVANTAKAGSGPELRAFWESTTVQQQLCNVLC